MFVPVMNWRDDSWNGLQQTPVTLLEDEVGIKNV